MLETDQRNLPMIPFDDYQNTDEFKYMEKKFNAKPELRVLKHIAQYFANYLELPFQRICKRQRDYMFGWLHEHWDEILPYFDEIIIIPKCDLADEAVEIEIK